MMTRPTRTRPGPGQDAWRRGGAPATSPRRTPVGRYGAVPRRAPHSVLGPVARAGPGSADGAGRPCHTAGEAAAPAGGAARLAAGVSLLWVGKRRGQTPRTAPPPPRDPRAHRGGGALGATGSVSSGMLIAPPSILNDFLSTLPLIKWGRGNARGFLDTLLENRLRTACRA